MSHDKMYVFWVMARVNVQKSLYSRGWQTISVKDQMVNILGFASLSQLLNSAIVAQKQP